MIVAECFQHWEEAPLLATSQQPPLASKGVPTTIMLRFCHRRFAMMVFAWSPAATGATRPRSDGAHETVADVVERAAAAQAWPPAAPIHAPWTRMCPRPLDGLAELLESFDHPTSITAPPMVAAQRNHSTCARYRAKGRQWDTHVDRPMICANAAYSGSGKTTALRLAAHAFLAAKPTAYAVLVEHFRVDVKRAGRLDLATRSTRNAWCSRSTGRRHGLETRDAEARREFRTRVPFQPLSPR